MGIKNLSKLIKKYAESSIHPITNNDLKNKIIAFDTSIILYQIITALRSSGEDLVDKNGNSVSHIYGIFIKSLKYLKMNINPIFIFDGRPSKLKLNILNQRTKIKNNAKVKLLDLKEKEDKHDNNEKILDESELLNIQNEKIKLFKQIVSISHTQIEEAAYVASLLGIPCIHAPEEADSQLSYMIINDLVDYIVSEDMDLLTFGSSKLIRNFSKSNMYEINLNELLEEGEITMDQFIDICILLGCDYIDSIDGIGIQKAWTLIKKYGSIEELIAKDKNIINNKYKLPDNFNFNQVREYFKNPRHITIRKSDLQLGIPQFDVLKKLLIDKYNFNEDNFEHMISFLRKKHNIFDKKYKSKKNDDLFVDDDDIIDVKVKVKAKPKKENNDDLFVDDDDDIIDVKVKVKSKKEKNNDLLLEDDDIIDVKVKVKTKAKPKKETINKSKSKINTNKAMNN